MQINVHFFSENRHKNANVAPKLFLKDEKSNLKVAKIKKNAKKCKIILPYQKFVVLLHAISAEPHFQPATMPL